MAWRVIVNGRDSGVIETNYAFALEWWSARATETGLKFTLEPI